MAEKAPPPMPQPERGPSPMQTEMDGITSVRQFFSILFGKHKSPKDSSTQPAIAETKQSKPEPQPKYPSPMQTEMDGITSVRQFFSILFGRHKKPDK